LVLIGIALGLVIIYYYSDITDLFSQG